MNLMKLNIKEKVNFGKEGNNKQITNGFAFSQIKKVNK